MKKEKIKVSAVSYLNTLPFLYGINHSNNLSDFVFEQDIPSVCAKKLIDNQVDIALIPIAAIPQVKTPYFISEYCLGAENKVKTVLLLSDVPLSEINSVYLDYQSKTSVNLVKILAKKHWHINPKWINTEKGFESKISGKKAGVIIGDRTFNLKKEYKYSYDLSEEWYKLTTLPFVFASWVANKKIDNQYINRFNAALKFGIENIDTVVKEYNKSFPQSEIDLLDYLNNYINFKLDDDKKKSIKLFYQYMTELDLLSVASLNRIEII